MAIKKKDKKSPAPAGYSGTSLIKKLGIKDGFRIRLIGEPDYYLTMLGELSAVRVENRKFENRDFIHLFSTSEWELLKQVPKLKDQIKPAGIIWISWPKKASKMPTDLSDSIVRQTGIENRLVDIKVCAVDERWSGLKFVIPVKDKK
jgi:hypothetical protein